MNAEQREKMIEVVTGAIRQQLDENTVTARRLYPWLHGVAEAAVDALGIEYFGYAQDPFTTARGHVFTIGAASPATGPAPTPTHEIPHERT